MKILIASDIHGSSYYVEKLYKVYERENPDQVFLLGDFLYHGPKNDLPKDYNVKKVIEILKKMESRIIALRGNCDSEEDLNVLNFEIEDGFRMLNVDGIQLYLTHGHINEMLPKREAESILITGHTHIYNLDRKYINPGSISLPKKYPNHTYIIYENHSFYLLDIDTNKLLQKLTIKDVDKKRKYFNPYS